MRWLLIERQRSVKAEMSNIRGVLYVGAILFLLTTQMAQMACSRQNKLELYARMSNPDLFLLSDTEQGKHEAE